MGMRSPRAWGEGGKRRESVGWGEGKKGAGEGERRREGEGRDKESESETPPIMPRKVGGS